MTATAVMHGYCTLTRRLEVVSHTANSARILRPKTPARLYSYDTLLERLAQDLQDMAAALGQFIQAAHAVVGQRYLARRRHVAPADQPHIGDGVMGGATRPGRDQRLRSPVMPATRGIRVVSMASARGIAGRIVVSRRASMDVPAPGELSRRMLWAERRRPFQSPHFNRGDLHHESSREV